MKNIRNFILGPLVKDITHLQEHWIDTRSLNENRYIKPAPLCGLPFLHAHCAVWDYKFNPFNPVPMVASFCVTAPFDRIIEAPETRTTLIRRRVLLIDITYNLDIFKQLVTKDFYLPNNYEKGSQLLYWDYLPITVTELFKYDVLYLIDQYYKNSTDIENYSVVFSHYECCDLNQFRQILYDLGVELKAKPSSNKCVITLSELLMFKYMEKCYGVNDSHLKNSFLTLKDPLIRKKESIDFEKDLEVQVIILFKRSIITFLQDNNLGFEALNLNVLQFHFKMGQIIDGTISPIMIFSYANKDQIITLIDILKKEEMIVNKGLTDKDIYLSIKLALTVFLNSDVNKTGISSELLE